MSLTKKRVFTFALVLVLVFALAACGGDNSSVVDDNSSVVDDDPMVGTVEEDTPEEEPQVSEPPDDAGSGEIDPNSIGFSDEWPDNEFTRQVPKPDFAIITIVSNDSVFSADFEIITEEQALTYAEQLIAAGFTPVRVGDSHHDKGERYRLDTDNAAGYSLVFTWLPNTTNLMINRLGLERGIDVGR